MSGIGFFQIILAFKSGISIYVDAKQKQAYVPTVHLENQANQACIQTRLLYMYETYVYTRHCHSGTSVFYSFYISYIDLFNCAIIDNYGIDYVRSGLIGNFYFHCYQARPHFLCAVLTSPQRTKQFCPQIEY